MEITERDGRIEIEAGPDRCPNSFGKARFSSHGRSVPLTDEIVREATRSHTAVIAPNTNALVTGFATCGTKGTGRRARPFSRGVHLIAHAAVVFGLDPYLRASYCPCCRPRLLGRTSPPAATWHWMPAHIAA